MLGYKYRSNLKYLEINGEITRIKQDANSLINHEIHTSTFDKLNDPFEFYVLEEITKLRHKLERDYGDKAKDVNKQLLEIKDFSKTIGIYSLSIQKPIQSFLSNRKLKQNCPTNELLWSHYANEHKGFCIEYDINKLKGDYILSNNVNEINIKYQLNPPNYKALKSVIKNNKDVMLTLFGIKSSSWKYENELRLIFDISGNKSYHPTALKSIYFGLNMNLEEKKFIINGLKNINVKFYQMEKSENSYILKATLLNQDSNLIKYKSTYKILKTSHNLKVENFHILYESSNLENVALQDFVSKFRVEKATMDCNISLYNDNVIESLIGKYPLYGKEKELMAEHLIAYSSFDAPNFIWMYPDRE